MKDQSNLEIVFTLPPIPEDIGEGKLYLGAPKASFNDMELLWEDENWSDHDGFTEEYAAIIEDLLRKKFRIVLTSSWVDHIEYHTATVAHLQVVK